MLHENHRKFASPVLPLPCKSCIVMTSLFTLVLCVYYDGFYEGRQSCDKISKRNQTLWSKAFSVGVSYKAVVTRWLKRLIKKIDDTGSNASLAILHTTYVTELNSSRTVLVRTVTQRCEIYAACDAAYLDMPLAEISQNSAVQWKLYTKNLGGPLIMAHRVQSYFLLFAVVDSFN